MADLSHEEDDRSPPDDSRRSINGRHHRAVCGENFKLQILGSMCTFPLIIIIANEVQT